MAHIRSCLYIATISILLIIFAADSVAGQTAPYCWQCTAEDLTISETWLGGSATDSSVPLPDCTPGSTSTAYLWVRFENNQNSQRNGILLHAKIFVNGQRVFDSYPNGQCIITYSTASSCLAGSGETGSSFDAMLVSIPYTCGTEVRVDDLYVSWDTGNQDDDCVCPSSGSRDCSGNSNAKCYHRDDLIIPGPVPAIYVEKTAYPTIVQSGGLVTYTYTVSNTGDERLKNVVLTDNQPVTLIRLADIVGNNDNYLDISEIWSFSATAHPTADVTNIATVNALGYITNTLVTYSDDATVHVIAIDMTKTAYPVEGCAETPVQFTITVSCAIPLTTISIVDLLPTGLTYVSSSPAGTQSPTNDHEITWTIADPSLPLQITVNSFMDGTAFGPIKNQATATATGFTPPIIKNAESIVTVWHDPVAIIDQIAP